MCALFDVSMPETGSLEGVVARHFAQMSTRGQILVDYIWIGSSGDDLRSKTRVLSRKPVSVEELPIIKFDGNLTGQVSIRPVYQAVAKQAVAEVAKPGQPVVALRVEL